MAGGYGYQNGYVTSATTAAGFSVKTERTCGQKCINRWPEPDASNRLLLREMWVGKLVVRRPSRGRIAAAIRRNGQKAEASVGDYLQMAERVGVTEASLQPLPWHADGCQLLRGAPFAPASRLQPVAMVHCRLRRVPPRCHLKCHSTKLVRSVPRNLLPGDPGTIHSARSRNRCDKPSDLHARSPKARRC